MDLYSINSDIDKALDEHTDHDTGEIYQEGFDAIENLMLDRSAKILSIAAAMKNKKAYADAVDAEIKKLKAKSAAATNSYERMQMYLTAGMEPDEKLKDARCSVSVREYEYVQIMEAGKLAPEYWRTYEPKPPEPDKAAIKEQLKRGNGVPGARLAIVRKVQVR